MAVTITGLITNNDKAWFEIDGDPSVSPGLVADMGSLASYNSGTAGKVYQKIGPAATDWDATSTALNGSVGLGNFLRLAIYDTNATGYHVDDVVVQNSQNISIIIATQAARSAGITYTIPNPGNAVTAADFVLTEGSQTINGAKTFSSLVVCNAGLTVNGSLTYVNTTNMEVTDALITLNKGGGLLSGAGVGFEIEELVVATPTITGYWKTSADRLGWVSLVPASAYVLNLDQSLLTANHKLSVPNTDGVLVARPAGTPGVATQIAFWQDANNIISSSGLTWTTGTNTLAATNATITTNLTVSSFILGSVIFAGAAGLLSQNNAKFFWDNTNFRLGLNTLTPSRTLHVAGTSLFTGAIRYADSGAVKANYEIFQAQISTISDPVTTIATIAIPTDSHVLIEASITGRCTGGTSGTVNNRAAYIRTVSLKNNGGTVTAPTPQADYTYEDVSSWNATISVSSTNAIITVKGALATNIDWTVTYKVIILS